MQKIDPKELTGKSAVAFVRIFERTYGNWKGIAARSFVSGIFTGLGATVGVAIVFVLVGYLLKYLGVLPVVGTFFKQIDEFLKLSISR
ncbi:hypothetical protein KKE14_00410 [Patescibacteria group bacterium]|nr:hypothetical protein [Patescibacteria group bacterium]